MKKNVLLRIVFCFMTIIATDSAFAEMVNGMSNGMSNGMPLTQSSVGLKTSMRKLWEDHITFTRNYIISDLANLGDKGVVAQRLLKNQEDIGDAIKPVYGDEAGKMLTTLLKEHIVIATKVVTAAKKNQKKNLAKASDEWSKNGNDIAIFLSGANPNLNLDSMKEMLAKHLEYTTDEVVARLGKHWDKDIKAYDKGHEHMLMFSDELTSAIVKQFPSKFE